MVKGKQKFEMVVDPEVAHRAKKTLQELRQEKKEQDLTVVDVMQEKQINLNDIFPTFDIFTDLKKGDRCTDEMLVETFETAEGRSVAAHFMLEAELYWPMPRFTCDSDDEWIGTKYDISIFSKMNNLLPLFRKLSFPLTVPLGFAFPPPSNNAPPTF